MKGGKKRKSSKEQGKTENNSHIEYVVIQGKVT